MSFPNTLVSMSNANTLLGFPSTSLISMSNLYGFNFRTRTTGEIGMDNVRGTSRISQSTQNSLVAMFSTKRMRISYTGPIFKLRRSSDNATQDFYSDYTGTLHTDINGISVSSWLNASTGFITTWFDQSGNNYNFSQTNTSFQPSYSNGRFIYNGSSQYLERSYIPAFNPTNYTMVFGCSTLASPTQYTSIYTSRQVAGSSLHGTAVYVGNTTNNIVTLQGTGGSTWNVNETPLIVTTNVKIKTAVQYSGNVQTTTMNGTSSTMTTGYSVNTSSPARIGAGLTESSNAAFHFNGEISDFYLFNTSISNTDRDNMLALI